MKNKCQVIGCPVVAMFWIVRKVDASASILELGCRFKVCPEHALQLCFGSKEAVKKLEKVKNGD